MTKAEKTRQFIIDKAAPLFNKKGYADTSLADLLDEVKLTKGSLYGNFASKEEIAVEAFKQNFDWLKNGYRGELVKGKTSIERLQRLVNYPLLNFKEFATRGGCPIMNAAIEADDNMDFLLPHVKEAFSNLKKLIVQIIAAGKQSGEIKASADEEQTAVVLIALIEGGLMLAKTNGKVNDLRTTVGAAEKIISDLTT